MQLRTVGYGLLMASLAVGACGGDSDDSSGGSSGGSEGMAIEDVKDEIIKMQCDAIDACASELISLYLAGMTCEDYFGRAFEDGAWPSILKAIDDGRVIYHGDKAEACLQAWSAQGCDIFTSRAPDICEETLEGTVEEGGSCTLTSECKGPLFCKVDGSCPGTCSPRQAEGGDCRESDDCQDGLNCDEALKQCMKPGQAGESCDEGQPECGIGLICADGEEGAPGTCKLASEVLAGNEGDSCNLEAGAFCKAGLSCVLEDWTQNGAVANCRAAVASGGTCGIGIPDPCPDDEYCNADPETTGSFEGTCTPLPGNGEPCVERALLQRCQPYHVCVEDTCREMQRLDGACEADSVCYSGNCESGTCAAVNACTD